MTDQPLGTILAGAGASAPEPAAPVVDEPEALITDPVKNEIGTDQVEGQPHPDEAKDDKPEAKDKDVGAAFKAQREGQQKRYTEQVADFERKLEAQNQAWEQRFAQLVAALQPPKPQQEPPDFFSDPNAAIRSQLEPFAQAQAQQREQFSQLLAIEKHGQEAVNEAFSWLQQRASRNDPTARAEWQAIMVSPHPYGALVDAHKRSQAIAEIGTDPAAYRERVKAELLAELQGRSPAAPPPTGAAALPATMPSNLADARNAGARTGPAWTGPPPLKDIFARRK